MIHLAKVIVTAIMALIFSSCNLNINGKTIKGNGKIIKKKEH
ncbi:hypothetical protein [Flavobacterium oreochromis]|nr:hypothetical protein [Flavobacterium oreochromis]